MDTNGVGLEVANTDMLRSTNSSNSGEPENVLFLPLQLNMAAVPVEVKTVVISSPMLDDARNITLLDVQHVLTNES